MHFTAICRPSFQKFFLQCPPWDHPTEPLTKQAVNNFWGKMAVDKIARIKAYTSHRATRKRCIKRL